MIDGFHVPLSAAFPWAEAVTAVENSDTEADLAYTQRLLDGLIPLIVKEPLTEIEEKCGPARLQSAEEIDCEGFPAAFTGRKREVRHHESHIVHIIRRDTFPFQNHCHP